MKRLPLILTLAIAGMAASQAADFNADGIFYNLLPDGSLEVAPPDAESVYEGTVAIPATVLADGELRKVSGIGSHAFYRCRSLESVMLPETAGYVADYAFFECDNLNHVEMPPALSSIGDRAFTYCVSLSGMKFPRNLASIGENAFSYCTSLTDIASLPAHTNIGDGAFSNCSRITAIDLSGHTGSLGLGAFSNCTTLAELTLDMKTAEIPPHCFSDCPALSRLVLPEYVERIGERAFSGCVALTEVTLPRHTELIGERAFSDCTSIKKITFGGTHIVIEEGAFENIESLPWLFITGVESVGHGAFANCSALEWIEIEPGLEWIGERAFTNCAKLGKVYMHSEWPPRISIDTFDSSTEENARLFVKYDCRERYELAAYWNRFVNVEETDRFPLSVDSMTGEREAAEIITEGGHILVSPASAECLLYDMAGRELFRGSASALAPREWPGGIYLLRAAGKSHKISLCR